MGEQDFDADLLVIGGGINGVGIARDAAGRGLRVILCEKGDLAGATSSASTKLIHGGLRYLEHYEFKLVRAALREREVLLNAAPHIVRPLRFILPQSPGVRPAWLIRIGLFLYDHLGERKRLAGSGSLNLNGSPYGAPLKPELQKAAYYSDCWVDDSRLVVLNALDAAERGAEILTRTECVHAVPEASGAGWQVMLLDHRSGTRKRIRARVVVNAAGPWAERCLADVLEGLPVTSMRLVRGSHIIVPRLFDHDNAYIFQNPDRRIVFAIPYQQNFTMIGTTDADFDGDLDAVTISAGEVDYLCETANRFFTRSISRDDIVWSFSGVRPLLGDGSDQPDQVTRDYRLDLRRTPSGSVALSVLGGKITTYRKLAEQAVNKLDAIFNTDKDNWTAAAPLPGGDIPGADIDAFIDAAARDYPWLADDLLERYARSYGTRLAVMLDGVAGMQGLGDALCPGLHVSEIRYLVDHEWAMTATDILWRRTKLGLRADPAAEARLQTWLDANGGAA
ncbi:MAG: glycerol-3-phosphate dehydrogenase [Rhodospirillales bacterium]